MNRRRQATDGRRRPWRLTVLLGVALVALLAMVLVAAPGWYRRYLASEAPAAAGSIELGNLKTLGYALKLHADEHDGKFPAAISEIEWRLNMPGMGRDGLAAVASQFHDPDTGAAQPWLYYAGHAESDPPETLLAASPVAFGPNKNKRMVLMVSGATQIIEESEFQRQAARGGR